MLIITNSAMSGKIQYDFHTHHGLILPKEKYKSKGLSGLINMGNTCFINSILQCLSNTLKLSDYFLSQNWINDDVEKQNERKQEFQFLRVYANLLENVWEHNQVLKPKSMIECLGKYIPKYKALQQQDSHEFLINTLELLHKGLGYSINIEINGHVSTDADRLMKASYEQWAKFYEKSYSYIVQCFGGLMYSKIKCVNCSFEEDVFEPFNCLSLEVNENYSLDDSLSSHFRECEHVKEWKCERCNGYGCEKSTKLWRLPNYLIIHFKRFSNNGSKIDYDVKYPFEDLNLTHLIASQKEDPNKYMYSLYSINYHSGSASSGHYWSSCKNLDGNWYVFNDGNVSKQNCMTNVTDSPSKDAYILFYSRKFIPSK